MTASSTSSATRRRRKRGLALLILLASTAAMAWLVLRAWPDPVVDVRRGATGRTIGAVHFGGPGRPDGALRDLLLARVRAMPRGQAIDWATYYFLDEELADALIAASRRGVRVRLVVEGDPRREAANGAVLARLRRDGLRGGLVVRPAAPAPFDRVAGRLHAKIYAFSWPRPVALVGSFNPSGGTGDDAADIVAEIGDQDRGHNMLVEIASPGLVRALVDHVGALARGHGTVGRFDAEDNRIVRDRDTQLYFYPRVHTDIVERALDALGPGDRLWAGISHLKGGAVGTLADAVKRGARIRLIVHDTERRVPQSAVDRLTEAGVDIRRYRHPQRLPMHDKFFVIRNGDRWTVYFGSLNFNRNSRFLNDEVLVRSTDEALGLALLGRFADIDREIDRLPPP